MNEIKSFGLQKEMSVWLTVIIPVFNDGKIAINALQALMDCPQRDILKGVEILCVEGGSKDDSKRVLEAFCQKYPNMRVIQCPSGAVAPKFNLGVRAARGEWVAFTESDCIPDPAWLPTWKRVIEEGQLKACAGRVRAYSDDPNLQLSIRDYANRKVVRPSFWAKVVPFYYGQGNNFLINKKVFQSIGGVDERLGAGAPGRSGQDAELNFRLFRAGISIGFEPEALVIHYPRETRESFLYKKRNYYYSSAWWAVVIHPTSPACLLGLLLRLLYPPVIMIRSLLFFDFDRYIQHWEEWKGFWQGVSAGLQYRFKKA